MEKQDYSSYGAILPGRSMNTASPNEKYKFTEKERDKESGLDYFGARYYESEIGRWLSIDPLTDKYPGWSPYNYCSNNPLNAIDPDGMDWYKYNETVIWQKSSDKTVTIGEQIYQNIGANYSMSIGNDTYNYEQNNLISINTIVMNESQWVSQFDGSPGENSRCYQACVEMLASTGNQTAGRGSEILVTELGPNGRAGSSSSKAEEGVNTIEQTINKGAPIIVGVDRKDSSPNKDRMTDHFVVIMGANYNLQNNTTSFRFFDPGTRFQNRGTSPSNTFKLSEGRLQGNFGNRQYTVTTVRKTR